MRAVLFVAATLFAFGGASALAQSDRNGAAQTFTRACMASPQMQGFSTPEPACACASGVLSGRTTDRQFYIAGRLTPFGNDQAGMRAEIGRMIAEGYTAEEVIEVGAIMTNSAELVTRTCTTFER